MHYLVTGTAGFIGFHLARSLLEKGYSVTGVDNINDYYEPSLKFDRLAETGIRKEGIKEGLRVASDRYPNYRFVKLDLENKEELDKLFKEESFDGIVHLAAQAGVRYSISHPYTYIQSNINGFMNILEACRHQPVGHLIFASSSSVYGLNTDMPFAASHHTDHPVSLYAATKKSSELLAHSYSHLYGIPATGLRFFTVYGPWGRPDMALFIFTRSILSGKPIPVYNYGRMERDFTYIDDIVAGILSLLDKAPEPDPRWEADDPDPSGSSAPYRLFNIGRGEPVPLMEFIHAIEKALGKKAKLDMQPLQPGDVVKTWADTSALGNRSGYKPTTSIETGVQRFIDWYVHYYRI